MTDRTVAEHRAIAEFPQQYQFKPCQPRTNHGVRFRSRLRQRRQRVDRFVEQRRMRIVFFRPVREQFRDVVPTRTGQLRWVLSPGNRRTTLRDFGQQVQAAGRFCGAGLYGTGLTSQGRIQIPTAVKRPPLASPCAPCRGSRASTLVAMHGGIAQLQSGGSQHESQLHSPPASSFSWRLFSVRVGTLRVGGGSFYPTQPELPCCSSCD